MPDALPGARILIVEDEPEFADLLALWVERHGWQPQVARDGAAAIVAFEAETPDLVLLDLSLPRLNGWQVIERMRATSLVPILLVTARDAEEDKIRGLGAGADDYVTKPLSFPELMARIEAVLRRTAARSAAVTGEEVRHPGLVIDGRAHRVVAEGHEIHLTRTEYRLLRHLAERPESVVGHADLLTAVWGAGYRDDLHLLRVTMRNLRAKLAEAAPTRHFIATSYGVGYRFRVDADAEDEG
ncbi:MAG TPA: response regulator transcription factor [Candidatus Limnocylindrales bacterium]|jgi:DNA-binding response OmpR family regulator